MTRLLLCHTCRSIDELPDYQGPPELDVLLDDMVQRHRFPDGNEHMGKLALVDTKDWQDNRKRAAIIEEIQAAVDTTGFPSEYYATKNTYQADALKCFADHRRPSLAVGCNDYHSDRKRLGNPTRAGWEAGQKVYLCAFCPYESEVKTAKRAQAGLYKEM